MAAESHAAPAIDIERLGVAYGDHLVLRDVSLRVEQGEIAVVVGGSGCGKSTLLKAAIGLVEPSAGTVRLLGSELRFLEESRQDALKKRVGVMFQYGALLNSLTIGENVALPLEMHTGLEADLVRDVVSTRLQLVGIGQAIDRYPNELSGGMRKRAALARAMVLEPDILFCDEPGAGLDPVTAAEVDRLLLTVNRDLGITLVVVTHELLSIERLGGRLLMLAGGEVLFSGPSEEARLSGKPELAGFFQPQ